MGSLYNQQRPFGRAKGVWDVIVFLQGGCPHLTSWVTTQAPLTHHWLQEHSHWWREYFTVLSPPLAYCAITPRFWGFGVLTEQTCIMTHKGWHKVQKSSSRINFNWLLVRLKTPLLPMLPFVLNLPMLNINHNCFVCHWGPFKRQKGSSWFYWDRGEA